jgi:hypothetical protein
MEPISAPQTSSKRASAKRAPVGAWIVSIIVLIGLVGAAVAFKMPIMKAWPPSERVYDAVGLNPPER